MYNIYKESNDGILNLDKPKTTGLNSIRILKAVHEYRDGIFDQEKEKKNDHLIQEVKYKYL